MCVMDGDCVSSLFCVCIGYVVNVYLECIFISVLYSHNKSWFDIVTLVRSPAIYD